MAVLFSEHILTFTEVTEPKDADGVRQVIKEGATHDVPGQLGPMDSDAAYNATLLDLKRPHKFCFNPEYAVYVQQGYHAALNPENTRIFKVVKPPKHYGAGGVLSDLDYMEVVLEEREFV